MTCCSKIIVCIALIAIGHARINRCNPIGHPDWSTSEYAANIRDQKSSDECWAFAGATYLEMAYAIHTGNKYRLSTEQIIDNLPSWADYTNCDIDKLDLTTAYNMSCVLNFIRDKGIMTEYEYTKSRGSYQPDKITPISIHHVMYYPPLATPIDTYNLALHLLRQSPVLADICALSLSPSGLESSFVDCLPDHNVVLVSICQSDGIIFAEYQNSFGSQWGDYGGYGYLAIGRMAAGTIRDNRGIFRNGFTTVELTGDFPNRAIADDDENDTSLLPPLRSSDLDENNSASSSGISDQQGQDLPHDPVILALLIVILVFLFILSVVIIGTFFGLRLWRRRD